MRRHAEGNYLLLLAELVEINQVVALITVNNQQAIAANNPLLCMLVKVLQLLKTKLICCLPILRDSNNLILRQVLFLVLGGEVVLASKDNKEQNRLLYCVNALNSCNLLLITLLHYLQLSSILYYYNYYSYYSANLDSLLERAKLLSKQLRNR